MVEALGINISIDVLKEALVKGIISTVDCVQ